MAHRILVVDDETDLLIIAQTALQTEGYVVETASNGAAGLAAARRQRPDLILLDVMMPDLSGFDVLRELKADEGLATVPIIMLTGISEKSKIQEALDSGIDYYIVKPFDFDDLLRKVGQALEEPKI